MNIEFVPLKKLKANPENPRVIKDEKFEKLVNSIASFPEMLEKRPLICVTDKDGKHYPLGGNMRLKAIPAAIKQLQNTEGADAAYRLKILERGVPVHFANDWSDNMRRQFVIKDNVGFGEWDYDLLMANFDPIELKDWGLDIPELDGVGPAAEEEKKDSWFLSIEFENENDTQYWYDQLTMKGLKVKIVQ